MKNYNGINFIYQANHGVSSARNTGIKELSIKSKFITFIDDSDSVSKNFFDESIKFFENNNVDLAITPITVVTNNNLKSHSLNYRFNTTKSIVDILSDYSYIHFHIGGVIFRSELLSDLDKPFDENINFWEDAKLINWLLLKRERYGLIKNATYYYNLEDQNSLTKRSWKQKERYNHHIINNFIFLINQSIEIYGVVIKYIQYLVSIHYLQFLLSHNFKKIDIECISENKNFLDLSKELFSYIDKSVIDDLDVDKKHKYFFYKLKDISMDNKRKNMVVYIHSYILLKRDFVISFSEESLDISDNSKVYIRKKNQKNEVKFIKKYKKDVIHCLNNDFSANIFVAHLSFSELFHDNIFIIKDYERNETIEVLSDSIISRILKKGMKLIGRMFEHEEKS